MERSISGQRTEMGSAYKFGRTAVAMKENGGTIGRTAGVVSSIQMGNTTKGSSAMIRPMDEVNFTIMMVPFTKVTLTTTNRMVEARRSILMALSL